MARSVASDVAVALLAAMLVFCASPLRAQPAPPEAEVARRAYDAARVKLQNRDFQGALTLFREAYAGSKSPNAMLYVARCLGELGQLVEARSAMSEALRDATARADAEPKYMATRDAAAAELVTLDARLAHVAVAFDGAPPDVRVAVNGTPLKPQEMGTVIAVVPGEVSVVATSRDQPRVERRVSVGAGETRFVALASGPAPPPPTASAATPAPGSDGISPLRFVGFALVGAGVAGLVTFAVAGLEAQGDYNTLKRECGSRPCRDPRYQALIGDGSTLDTVANVGLVVGVAGLLAGGTMILLGGAKERRAHGAQASALGLDISRREGVLRYHRAF